MKPTYRDKDLPDYFFGGFRSTLNKHKEEYKKMLDMYTLFADP